ncbi:MAG: hypothetical protein NTY19_05155 [Planctomycetota bacterium]|nr:hypothetical protein [Planctomycetota bacterium]
MSDPDQILPAPAKVDEDLAQIERAVVPSEPLGDTGRAIQPPGGLSVVESLTKVLQPPGVSPFQAIQEMMRSRTSALEELTATDLLTIWTK